ncbi:uncharacterized protein LOC143884820 [Tasmannia lanceolata]|uniref:uncharacterized protein LOC143884820 n=1 Tax=Tasmannia lanceolata TaxID=3420 RepID=UPI004063139B
MKRKTTTKSTSKLLVSPLPFASPQKSPKPYDFNISILATSSKKTLASSPLLKPLRSPPKETLMTISDVKDLASSRLDSIKRQLDLCHSEILKEADSSKCRLSKRSKIQSRTCMQVSDEAEKEYKKISDRISENTEVLKASYSEFITQAQATASRVCKVSIPELTQSLEKAIEGLRSRYGIPSAPI